MDRKKMPVCNLSFHVKKFVYKIITLGNSYHHQTDKGACHSEVKYFSI